MTTKLLIADDSLTIQKVVKITLANEPFEIIECLKDSDLESAIQKHQPQILLLDFNLSEKYSGYELCQQIKKNHSKINIVMMYGTFDTIDEEALKGCWCINKIVKPFDSNKFIALCRSLVDNTVIESVEVKDIFSDTPNINIKPEIIPSTQEDWSIGIPQIIGQAESISLDLPPIIDSKQPAVEMKKEVHQNKDIQFPKDADLDYPSIELESNGKTEPSLEMDYHPRAKLVSVSELKLEPQELVETKKDKGTDILNLNEIDFDQDNSSQDIQNIENLIQDEVGSDLWQADEKIKSTPMPKPAKPAVTVSQEKITSALKEYDHIVFDDPLKVSASKSDQSEAMIQQKVHAYLDQHIEKICWDIIPKIAEKIIREELEKISNKISQKY